MTLPFPLPTPLSSYPRAFLASTKIPELVRAFDATLLVDARCHERVWHRLVLLFLVQQQPGSAFWILEYVFARATVRGKLFYRVTFLGSKERGGEKIASRSRAKRVFFSRQSSLLPSSVRYVPDSRMLTVISTIIRTLIRT